MTYLHESMGLLAYYESLPMTENTTTELTRSRKKMLRDFSDSKNSNDIKFLLWVINKYPRFLQKLLAGKPAFKTAPKEIIDRKEEILDIVETTSKKKVNKKIDKLVLKSIENKIVKRYIKSKLLGSKFHAEDLIASNDNDEILKFLILNEQKFGERVKEIFNIEK